MASVRAHLIISGRVQGVWYRASARDEARNIGLVGWVKNLHNGNVEAVAEGSKESIEQFIRWCHEGPPHAKVKEVQVDWQDPTGEFREFGVKY